MVMAAFGLSRDCLLKALAKFDLNDAKLALNWIEDVTALKFSPPVYSLKDQFDVRDILKDGQALCMLMNALQPGSIKKINKTPIPFKQMENIEQFIRGCRTYGMRDQDLFQTHDLYEGKTMYAVISCIFVLGSLAKKNGFKGPTIGVKISEENKRAFTKEQLLESHSIINLQYGTNKHASQKGMSFGTMRKI